MTVTVWTPEKIHKLYDLIEEGHSISSIARRLNVTRIALQVKARKMKLPIVMNSALLTGSDVAALLGVGCAKTITYWIKTKRLVGRNGGTQKSHIWRIAWEDLYRFLENPNCWMVWHPERITDEGLCIWAIALRKNQPRWLTSQEVANLCSTGHKVVNAWIVKGWLPAIRYGNWWIREDVLDGWTLPANQERGHIQPAIMTPLIISTAVTSDVHMASSAPLRSAETIERIGAMYARGWSASEIAIVLGTTANTIRVRISEARKRGEWPMDLRRNP